jgi:hypothetical protein
MALKARGSVWYLVKKLKGRKIPIRRSTGYRVLNKQTKEAALRRAAEIELKLRAQADGWEKDIPTVKTYWLETYRPAYTLKKRAPEADDRVMAHVANSAQWHTPLDQVTKSDCQKYLNARRAAFCANPTRKTPKRLREGTVQRERSFLQAFFQQAVDDEVIDGIRGGLSSGSRTRRATVS